MFVKNRPRVPNLCDIYPLFTDTVTAHSPIYMVAFCTEVAKFIFSVCCKLGLV